MCQADPAPWCRIGPFLAFKGYLIGGRQLRAYALPIRSEGYLSLLPIHESSFSQKPLFFRVPCTSTFFESELVIT